MSTENSNTGRKATGHGFRWQRERGDTLLVMARCSCEGWEDRTTYGPGRLHHSLSVLRARWQAHTESPPARETS